MREPRLPSEHFVKHLNTSIIEKFIFEYCEEHHIDMTNQVLDANWEWGIVEKAGKHYLLCSEGVGSGVALETKKDKIPWYRKTVDENGKTTSFEIIPFIETKFCYDELQEWGCIEENSKPLHEFIRVHNQRVEDNFNVWERFLNGVYNSV